MANGRFSIPNADLKRETLALYTQRNLFGSVPMTLLNSRCELGELNKNK